MSYAGFTASCTADLSDMEPRPKQRRNRTTKPARPGARLLSLKQCELEYGPPYRTLYQLAKDGHLPYVILPGQAERIWIERAQIERLIQRGRQDAA